jgi:hypothetical protein
MSGRCEVNIMDSIIRKRTPEEIQAYTDGYNACFERFCECLKGRKSVPDSIKKMRVFVDTVNGVAGRRKHDEDS